MDTAADCDADSYPYAAANGNCYDYAFSNSDEYADMDASPDGNPDPD